MFWARQTPGAITRLRIHVPVAADMAAISSDQLFSDSPSFLIAGAHIAKATRSDKKIQDRTNEIIEEDGIRATLLEAGEIGAALGGVFWRVAWDREFAPDRPLLTVVHPDAVIPEFLFGRLVAATIWRVVMDDGKQVYRQLERHEIGHIYHGLYEGSQTKLGKQVPLSLMPETTNLQSSMSDPNQLQTGLTVDISTGLTSLAMGYVPNMRPNRADRTSPLGRSDYSGVEGLMDSLDETFTSWMRDIRLGRARIIVPEEYLGTQKRGQGGSFDLDREVFETLKMHPQEGQITTSQFNIRTKEHEETANALIERIVATAGYSGSTFGLKSAATVERTATEVKAREHRTLSTRGRKIEYWSPALADMMEVLLEVDQKFFGGPGVARPRLEFPESIQESSMDLATAVQLLDQARAISLETKVAMVHPDWDPEEVAAEVERISGEQAVITLASNGIAPANPPPPASPNAPQAPNLGPMPPGTTTNPQPANPISQPAP
jgi:A118 family predicted phage portal protein